MKKINLFLAVLLILVFGVFIYKQTYRNIGSANNLTQLKVARIAILQYISHPALDEIRQGFIDTLQKEVNVEFKIFNANGNRILLRSQAEEIVQNDFDLIFSIPTVPSLILKEVTAQRNKLIPIVGAAITNPVDNKLIDSMESSGNNLVIVAEDKSFDKQIERILFLKPDIKKVLLVYNSVSNADLEKDKQIFDQLLKKRNIQLNAIQILNNNEITQKVPNFINGQDAVLVLKDNMIVAGIESLISVCNRFKVPLFASDLNSAIGCSGCLRCSRIRVWGFGRKTCKTNFS